MPKKKIKLWLLAGICMAAAGFLYSCDRQEPAVLLTQENISIEEPSAGGDESQEVTTEVKTLFVHVCGAVVREGVYELPEGSRCQDAVDAAGGFAEDADKDYLNLAALLSDGQKIQIPTKEEAESMEAESKEASDGLVNINTADLDELMTLSGIGEARAQAIISYREENGPFAVIEDIMKVPGIKESAFSKIKAKIKVGISNGKQSISSG